MLLSELDQATPEERDALARNIMTALVKAWAWDHGMKAQKITIINTREGEEGKTE